MAIKNLQWVLSGKDKNASKTFNKVGKSVDGLAGKFKGLSAKGLGAAGLGAGVGAAFSKGLLDSMNFEKANDKLAAQLGLSAKESARLGGVASDLFAGAYGSSMDEVSAAVGAVVSSIADIDQGPASDIESMTAKVLDLATAFEVDVTRAAQIAGQMVTSGLAKDATQAMDLLTVSMQSVPAAVREDLMDAIDEYGPFMADIGVVGQEAFGLLVSAAENGMYGIDKTGDALKEFTIRATDMSAASKVGYDKLGLSQKKLSKALLKGGKVGSDAFGEIITALQDMEDPLEQSQAALALFGTPLEDLSVTEIPKFIDSLDGSAGALLKVDGAAAAMGNTLNDNAATKIESFKRRVQVALVDWIGNDVVPAAEKFAEEFQNGVGPGGEFRDTVEGIGDAARDAWPHVKTAFEHTKKIVDFVIEHKDAFTVITAGVVAYRTAMKSAAIWSLAMGTNGPKAAAGITAAGTAAGINAPKVGLLATALGRAAGAAGLLAGAYFVDEEGGPVRGTLDEIGGGFKKIAEGDVLGGLGDIFGVNSDNQSGGIKGPAKPPAAIPPPTPRPGGSSQDRAGTLNSPTKTFPRTGQTAGFSLDGSRLTSAVSGHQQGRLSRGYVAAS